MKREESLIKEIYKGEDVTFPMSNAIIKCFSAYMEKYCDDFKYTSRYLNSHLGEFEKCITYNKKFDVECDKFKDTVINSSELNNIMLDIKHNKKIIDFNILINESISFATKSNSKFPILFKNYENVLSMKYLNSFQLKDEVVLALTFSLQYEELSIVEYVYDIKTTTDYVKLIHNFLDKVVVQKLVERDEKKYIDHIISLKKYIPKDFVIKINFGNEFLFNFDSYDTTYNLVSSKSMEFIKENFTKDVILMISKNNINEKYFVLDNKDIDNALIDFQSLVNKVGGSNE